MAREYRDQLATRHIDAISSRPEFAFDCQRFPGHVSVHLKDGIGNEDDSSALSADRVIFTAIGNTLSKRYVTPEVLRISV